MIPETIPVSLGRYQIVREVGRGGSAVVYEALDTQLGRTVALKVLTGDDPRMVDRLHREAASLAKLRHPDIVPVHDVGEANGTHFIAMDFIRGSTLADVLPRTPPRRRLEILETVARAAHFAHEHGIVHRDLKPQNVLIEEGTSDELPATSRPGPAAGAAQRPRIKDSGPETPKVFLSDFGLARELDSRTLTRSGSALGTPFYMAPEQVRGDRRLIKPTTDVWALGVMLYEAVADRPPFSAQTALEVYDSILRSEPKPLRNTPQDLALITFKALEKDPFRRYPSARAFADDLRRHLNGEPIQARPASLHYRVWKKIRRHPLPVAIAAILFITSTIATAVVSSAAARELSRARAEAHQLMGSLPTDRKAALAALIRADHLARTADDPDLRYTINRKLADLALAGNNYDLARLAFASCEALHSGESLQPLVDERELAESRRRKERIEAALADLRAGLGRTDRAAGAPLLDDYVFECVQYNDERTVSLLADTLGPLAARADKDTRWSQEERDLMTFAFRVLGRLDRDSVVAPLALMMDKLWDHALAVECGIALCNTKRAAADPGVMALRKRFGVASETWRQISRVYSRVPAAAAGEPSTATAFNKRGLTRKAKGDLHGAIEDYSRAIELHPGYADAYNNRGIARRAQGDLAGAIEDYSKALEIDPQDANAFSNRGSTRKAQGDLAGAIEDYSRAIELHPGYANAYNNRGLARRDSGDIDGAIEDYSKAVELDPQDANAFSNRGMARGAKGDLAGAIEDCTRAVNVDPRYADAYNNRGVARRAHGDLEGAIEDYSKAIELKPRYSTAFYNRALVRKDRGELGGAIMDWDRFLALTPDHPSAPLVREAIRAARAELEKHR